MSEYLTSFLEGALVERVSTSLPRVGVPADQARSTYLVLDSLFRFHLPAFLKGDKNTPADFESDAAGLLERMV